MRPYSEDLRERAVQRAEAGETIREIATALRISPSCVSKWRKRQRETGSLAPDQVGGHKPRTLTGEHAEWLRARVAEGPFTTRGLTAELAARGIKTDRRAVWMFLHAEGLIPPPTDQNPCAQSRTPMDMMRQGCSMRRFQWWQQWATMSS